MPIPLRSNLYLGSPTPALVVYLARPPELPESETDVDIARLVALNGNHWRKIFTLLAKLSSPDEEWRRYRDCALLHKHEALCFGDRLLPLDVKHLVAGKANWARLGLDTADFEALDPHRLLWRRGDLYLTPYFDYRQFPNTLVEILKASL